MKHPKTLALIMAGGEGNRMELLTKDRAKPALPYAGVYRLLDFPLSNCMHSGISHVWVIEQFLPHSLNDHLANGRPWDLDRTYGGLRIMPPHIGTQEGGWHRGNADAIHRNARFIREFNPDLLLVLSADHVYKLDYNSVIERHIERQADVTMVTTEVPIEEAGRFGTVRIDEQGRVTDFEYKPDTPRSTTVTAEVFVYNAAVLLDTLDELAARGPSDDEESSALKDFGHELIPMLVERGRAYSYPLEGYWRDLGTIESYWRSHMDLLADEPLLDLDQPEWPILTYGVQRMPARIERPARIENSLIAPGCLIRGRVVDSVLAPGVVVEQGAEVSHAIVFSDVRIATGAKVAYSILDSDARIGEGARIGEEPQAGAQPNITLVGARASVAAGTTIAAGERVESSTEYGAAQHAAAVGAER
ncbi:MAG TPA: glucose-1-phosphate adenylyltransferase family protein [Herpetosiphonaceae bacterium]